MPANTDFPIVWTLNSISNNINLTTPSTDITITETGTYSVQVQANMTHSGSGAHEVNWWLNVNGATSALTGTIVTLAPSRVPATVLNLILSLSASDVLTVHTQSADQFDLTYDAGNPTGNPGLNYADTPAVRISMFRIR